MSSLQSNSRKSIEYGVYFGVKQLRGPVKMLSKITNNIFENVAGTEKASSKENLILGK